MKVLVLVVALVGVSGCRSLGELRPARAQWTMTSPPGTERHFPVGLPYVYDAAVRAARDVGLNVAEVDPGRRYLLAQRDMTAFSWGELVGVYFQSVGACACHTLVRVESRRVLATNVTAKDFTFPVLEAIARELYRPTPLAAAAR